MQVEKLYSKYNKFDVVYADFGHKPHGVMGGIRPAIIMSNDASNHTRAPQVTVVPLSSKIKDIPVHVQIGPKDVQGYALSKLSDFVPEDIQTIAKADIRGKCGFVSKIVDIREELDRALIKQFNLLDTARKMIKEEMEVSC